MKTSQLVAVVFFIFELIRLLYNVFLQRIDDMYFLTGSLVALVLFPVMVYWGIEILQRKSKSNMAIGIYVLASFVLTPIIPIIIAVILDRTMESPKIITTNEDVKIPESQQVEQVLTAKEDSEIRESPSLRQEIARIKGYNLPESQPIKQEIVAKENSIIQTSQKASLGSTTKEESKLKESQSIKQRSNKSLQWMTEAQREEFESLARKKNR